MSLSIFLLRLASVEALKGHTLAQERVYDAPFDPIMFVAQDPKPLIAIYTGEEKGHVTASNFLDADISVDLIFQILLPEKVKISGSAQDEIVFEARDSGAAALHDLISSQILRVLQTDQDPWAVLWRDLILPATTHDNGNIHRQSLLLEMADGVNLPMFELRLHVHSLSDPVFCNPLPTIWEKALDLMDKKAHLENV